MGHARPLPVAQQRLWIGGAPTAVAAGEDGRRRKLILGVAVALSASLAWQARRSGR